MCRVPWVQVCSIFPRIPSNIFCYISHFLQSKLQYSNSPLEIPCAAFRALGHVCREKYKILQWNSNSPIESPICEFSNQTQFPHSTTCPRNSPWECEKRFVKEQTYIKRPYPLLLHSFTAFGA